MKMDIENFRQKYKEKKLVQGMWNHVTLKSRVCLMAALVPGAESVETCESAGWPRWLVELVICLFDRCKHVEHAYAISDKLVTAISTADRNGVDWAEVSKGVRTDIVLAMIDKMLNHPLTFENKYYMKKRYEAFKSGEEKVPHRLEKYIYGNSCEPTETSIRRRLTFENALQGTYSLGLYYVLDLYDKEILLFETESMTFDGIPDSHRANIDWMVDTFIAIVQRATTDRVTQQQGDKT